MILNKIIHTYIGVIFNWCQGPPVRRPAKTRGKLGLFSLMYRTLRPLYYYCTGIYVYTRVFNDKLNGCRIVIIGFWDHEPSDGRER